MPFVGIPTVYEGKYTCFSPETAVIFNENNGGLFFMEIMDICPRVGWLD